MELVLANKPENMWLGDKGSGEATRGYVSGLKVDAQWTPLALCFEKEYLSKYPDTEAPISTKRGSQLFSRWLAPGVCDSSLVRRQHSHSWNQQCPENSILQWVTLSTKGKRRVSVLLLAFWDWAPEMAVVTWLDRITKDMLALGFHTSLRPQSPQKWEYSHMNLKPQLFILDYSFVLLFCPRPSVLTRAPLHPHCPPSSCLLIQVCIFTLPLVCGCFWPHSCPSPTSFWSILEFIVLYWYLGT